MNVIAAASYLITIILIINNRMAHETMHCGWPNQSGDDSTLRSLHSPSSRPRWGIPSPDTDHAWSAVVVRRRQKKSQSVGPSTPITE